MFLLGQFKNLLAHILPSHPECLSVNSSIHDHEGQNEIEFYRTLLDFDPEIFEISTISRSFDDLTYGTSIMRHQIRA